VSEVKAFQRCPRYHHIKYELGYRSVGDAEALTFGRLIHIGLEVWWNTGGDTDAALEAVNCCSEVELVDAYELAKAQCLLLGYGCRWADEGLTIRGSEVEFVTKLLNPDTNAASKLFALGGKIDGLVEDERKEQWIVEHKTTSMDITDGSEYWQKLRMDAQVSTYFVGARSVGVHVSGCIYDVIKKPMLRPISIALTDDAGVKVVLDGNGERVRTKDGKKWRETGDSKAGYELQTRRETPEEYRVRLTEDIACNPDKYFAREKVVRLADDELDAAADMWQVAKQIREAQRLNRHPRHPDSCMNWNRPCEYFGVCTRTASLEDLSLFRKVERVHEELSLPTYVEAEQVHGKLSGNAEDSKEEVV